MLDFEKLGMFYLGRQYDPVARQPKKGLMLYDSRDLLTHAVCIGMTGSGKTGLCLTLIEEAVLDGIPVIAIDPKGDIANLMLTFPELRGEDLSPWVSEHAAAREGLSVEAYAEAQAGLWRTGLAEWGQDGQRISRLKHAADFSIYTPGSNSGLPLSIVRSFAAPSPAVLESSELLREKVNVTATCLLSLVGIDVDPLKSREHILIAAILNQAWRLGEDLDLVSLIHKIQTPPVAQVGAFDVESFFPAKERFQLALSLNAILASPGFNVWSEGEALDIDKLLHTSSGQPRVSILSISHLSDQERMFFVSLLASEIVAWMRTQPGTDSLRAVLYIDEVLGYLPPVANPPSKAPLITLIKQARAFGLGLVLATQNPVDLDYKALSNAGTWFIGRLQTERDKAHVLEGLEGACGADRGDFNRGQMEQILSGLDSRVFLMNNVHDDRPEVFQSRWAMSYLCGPLTRVQIKTLMDDKKLKVAQATPPYMSHVSSGADANVFKQGCEKVLEQQSPVLHPDVSQFFAPFVHKGDSHGVVLYKPVIYGSGSVHFLSPKHQIDFVWNGAFITPITEDALAVDWNNATEVGVAIAHLHKAPVHPGLYDRLPGVATQAKNYSKWSKAFGDWLATSRTLELYKYPWAEVLSQPAESQRDFCIRMRTRAKEMRDRAIETFRKKYAPKIAALDERLRRAKQVAAREAEEMKEEQLQSVISVGTTLLGAFMGRKVVSATNLRAAASTARKVSQAMGEQRDVAHAKETVEAIEQQIEALDVEFQLEMTNASRKFDADLLHLETILLRTKKSDVKVDLVTLLWVPYWQDTVPAT